MSQNVIEFYQSEGWRMTSRFGWRKCPMSSCKTTPWRDCTVCKGTGQNHHNGIDFGDKPAGYPILSPDDGTVTAVATQWANGKIAGAGHYLGIRAISGPVIMCFFHLQRQLVKVGAKVKNGDAVALNGSTGNSTGPHLHFELRKDIGIGGLGSGLWGDPALFQFKSVAVPVAPSNKFRAGDWVRTTDKLTLRGAPGTGALIIAVLEAGSVGQILESYDNGKHVTGHHWWNVSMPDSGRPHGWMAESWLVATEKPKEPEPEPGPTPDPESKPDWSDVGVRNAKARGNRII